MKSHNDRLKKLEKLIELENKIRTDPIKQKQIKDILKMMGSHY